MAKGNMRGRVLGIGAAMVLSSGFAFLFLALASRWLGPELYPGFMSSWGLLFGLAAAMLAAEQEIARQTTIAALDGSKAPAAVLQVAALSTAFALLALLVILLFPAGRQVLADSPWLFVLTAVGVVGFAVQYLVRGVALGVTRTRDYIWIILGDGGLRLLAIAALLLAAVAPTIEVAFAAVVLGCFSWLLVLVPMRHSFSWRTQPKAWPRVGATIGGLMIANSLQAVLLTAYPTLVTALLGASTDLATFFGIVTLSRIPLIAMSPIQTLAVPEATRLIHAGRAHVLTSLLAKIGLGLIGAIVVTTVVSYYLGPWVMRVFLGEEYAAAPGVLVAATMAGGCVLAVAMLHTSVLVALKRYSLVVLSWAVGVATAIVTILSWPGDKSAKASAGFAVATVASYLVSGASVLLSRRDQAVAIEANRN